MTNIMTKEELIELREKVLNIKNPGDIEKILNHKTMYERFEDMAKIKPDAPAILYFGNIITYRQMLSLIDTAAKGFSQIGIKYNDVVTMSLLSTPYAIISLYALDKIGAIMHMVNCASSIDEIKRELDNFNSEYFVANDLFYTKNIQKALEESGIKKIVTTSLTDGIPMGLNADKLKYQFIEKIKGVSPKQFDGKKLISYEQLLNMGRNCGTELSACKYEPNKVATIAYTSGSTGKSKACVATWDGLDSMIQVMGMTETGRFEPNDVMFTTFPLWIYYSLLNMIHEPLSLGVALALDPLFDPKNIIKRNEQYKFNHWLTIPPYIKTMVDMNKPTDCSNWKIIITGGDTLLPELKIKADEYIKKNNGNTHVEQGYGASEVLGSFAYSYNDNPTLGSVGIPCVGNMIKIFDIDTMEELGNDQIGVGYLYTPARMSEYFGDEEATRHNLITDENGVVWYNTEDLLHKNERGEIFLDGRIRRIALTIDAKGNPTKIIPERTKKCIYELNFVDKCEVITIEDDRVINKAIAFVVLNKEQTCDDLKELIASYCEKNIPEYMLPAEIYFVSEIPVLSNGKPDLAKLEQMAKEFANNNFKVKKLFKKK